MLLTLRHYKGFLSYAVDVLRYVALNVVNLRCLVVIHWSFHWRRGWDTIIYITPTKNWNSKEMASGAGHEVPRRPDNGRG